MFDGPSKVCTGLFCFNSSYSIALVCGLRLDEVARSFRVYAYEFVFLPLKWFKFVSGVVVSFLFTARIRMLAGLFFVSMHFGLSKAYLSDFLSRN